MDTIEFLQQEWINNGNFMNLGDERDPNVGLQEDGAIFTIPQDPIRRRIHDIQTFNVLRGGEYFFMPSLSALKWIGGCIHRAVTENGPQRSSKATESALKPPVGP
jgi:hypothetical protein